MTAKKTATEKFSSKNSFYQILSRQCGNAVSVEGRNEGNGTLLTMDVPDQKAKEQEWKIVPAAGGFCRIQNVATGCCLDLIEGGTENGTWLHQWETCDTDTQLWKLEPASDGFYKIISKAAGRCVDIVDISSEAGAHLQIWEQVSGENQEWKLSEIPMASETKKARKHRGTSRKATKAKKPAAKPAETTTVKTEKPAVAATSLSSIKSFIEETPAVARTAFPVVKEGPKTMIKPEEPKKAQATAPHAEKENKKNNK